MRKAVTVVVEGDTVKEILEGYPAATEGALVVDLKSKTVYPGFIDMHVHIESESSPTKYLERYQLDPADVAYDAAVYARRTLMAGFTTVRDLGGSGVNIALRNAINKGKCPVHEFLLLGKHCLPQGGMAIRPTGIKPAYKAIQAPRKVW